MATLYLDTETTGLSPAHGAALVELAVADDQGKPVLDTLINPGIPIPADATRIHGITDAMVRTAPSLSAVIARLRPIIASAERVIIYNASFDMPFLPQNIWGSTHVNCAMRTYAELRGTKWQKLEAAAAQVGHVWTGTQHRALADALAARSVWHWCRARL